MSADNWIDCPRCFTERSTHVETLEADTRKAYGVIPAEKYELRRATDAEFRRKLEEGDPSLREDYDIGVTDGVFRVDYSASCAKCSFSFEFKHGPVEVKK